MILDHSRRFWDVSRKPGGIARYAVKESPAEGRIIDPDRASTRKIDPPETDDK